jgi:hypothetical protein
VKVDLLTQIKRGCQSDCRDRERERDKKKDVGENYVMRSFMICISDILLLG